MSSITVQTAFNIDLEFRIAPFHKRMLAWLTDVVIVCLYYYIMIGWLFSSIKLNFSLSATIELILVILPVFFYSLLCEIFLNGASLGKKLLGLQVIDREGKNPTYGQYALRWILSFGNLTLYIMPYVMFFSIFYVIFLFIFYIPDVISIAVSRDSQRLGDLAAGTVVIDRRQQSNIYETIYLEPEEDNYTPKFPQVMRLTDRDINGIRNLLHTRGNNRDTENYMARVAERIREVLKIETEMEPRQLLEQLLRDYNHLTGK